MSDSLLPSPELAPPSMAGLTPAERIQVYSDLVESNEQLVMAGIRRKLSSEHGTVSDADVIAAFREWKEHRMAEHAQVMEHMVSEFQRRWDEYVRKSGS